MFSDNIDVLAAQVEKLIRQNADLVNRMDHMESRLTAYRKVVSRVSGVLNLFEVDLNTNNLLLNNFTDNACFEVIDKFQKETFFFPTITSHEHTMELLRQGKSMVRYGDGEFSIIANESRPVFQDDNASLASRLKEILLISSPEDKNVCIAISDIYGDLSRYTFNAAGSIRSYLTLETRKKNLSLLKKDSVYHDAYISRIYLIYRDKTSDTVMKKINAWKKVWQGRDIILVEGKYTRAGMGNDLFDNAGSVKRILCPIKNAYDKYDKILKSCREHATPASLFLLALGPTATVLAYDLARLNYQAIDIGHLDIEYEWFRAGQGMRVPVKNKYFQEENVSELPVDVADETKNYTGEEAEEYFSQIIEDFSV